MTAPATRIKPTLVRLLPAQRAKLAKVTERTGATMAWLIRRAVDDLLEQYNDNGERKGRRG